MPLQPLVGHMTQEDQRFSKEQRCNLINAVTTFNSPLICRADRNGATQISRTRRSCRCTLELKPVIPHHPTCTNPPCMRNPTSFLISGCLSRFNLLHWTSTHLFKRTSFIFRHVPLEEISLSSFLPINLHLKVLLGIIINLI